MKQKIKINLLLIMFLIILSSLFVSGEYTELGNNNNYVLGQGNFNSELTTVNFATKTLNNPKWSPLVSDLNNDGINEIIVFDGNQIRLFHNSQLDIVDSLSLTLTDPDKISNVIIFDIDGDSLNEIIFASEEDEDLYIIEYDGNTISIDSNYSLSAIPHVKTADFGGASAGQYILGCESVNKCIIANSELSVALSGQANSFSASFFNFTGLGDIQELQSGGAGDFRSYCLPKVRSLDFTDLDNDGTNEVVLNFVEAVESSSNPFIHFEIISLNLTNSIIVEKEFDNTYIYAFSTFATGITCYDNDAEQYFSGAYVDNIDGASSNGEEIVVATMTSSDEFKMYSYTSNGNFLDDYPEIQTSDGIIVSNIFKANAFIDTGLVDFCVIGQKNSTNILDVTCGSEQTGGVETVEFILPTEAYYNITQRSGNINILAHSGQHSSITTTTTNNDLSEIITSYGIGQLSYSGLSCTLSNICDLDLIYENPKGDSTLITSDVENIGLEDIILMTDTNLWYIDDGFSNTPGEIDLYSVNPCIDSVWKQNTSVLTSITPTDVDGDKVSARSILYAGDTITIDDGNEWNYTNVNHSYSFYESSGEAFEFYNGFYYLLGNGGDDVTVFDTDFQFNGTTYSIVANVTNAQGMTRADNYWYISDFDTQDVVQFDLDFNAITRHDVSGETAGLRDVHYDGNNFYITDFNAGRIYKYNSSFGYTGQTYDVSGQDLNANSIFKFDNNWYLLGNQFKKVYKYTSNWIYTGESFDISTESSLPEDIYNDGTQWILTDDNNDFHFFYESVSQTSITEGQDSGWSNYATSGTTFSFSHIANESISSGTLTLLSRDESNPAIVDQIDLSFSVSSLGVSAGDCLTEVDVLTSTEIATVDTTIDPISAETLEDLRDETLNTLGVPQRFAFLLGVFIIIVFIIGAFYILSEYNIKDGMASMYFPIFAGIFAWIMTVAFKLIPGWTIIVGILFSSAIIGFKVYQSKTNTGGI